MKKNNSIINSLKRLERAGSENSRMTQKLREAAKEVAGKIIINTPGGVTLPEGYKVVNRGSKLGDCYWLRNKEGEIIDGNGEYVHSQFENFVEIPSRQAILDFSKDITEGLLEKIADFVEERTLEEEAGIEGLEEERVTITETTKKATDFFYNGR